jgi:hypothetical protein
MAIAARGTFSNSQTRRSHAATLACTSHACGPPAPRTATMANCETLELKKRFSEQKKINAFCCPRDLMLYEVVYACAWHPKHHQRGGKS